MQWFKTLNLDMKMFDSISKFNHKTKETEKFFNVECAFDIETTSQIYNEEKCSFMYIWQFGIKDVVYYGRTWNQFNEFLNMLIEQLQITLNNRLIIYVHNLGYEFQFIRKFFDWFNVFSIDDRKPIKATTLEGLEFKCSYILSGLSLAYTSRNLTKPNHKIKKLEGCLDYSLMRNEKTILSEQELEYCKNDILIILFYINEQIEYYGNITKIPLTNTGRVRAFVKEKCFFTEKSHKKSSKGKFKRYKDLMKELTLTQEDYIQLKRGFMGGFTHASLNYQGKTLNDVVSIDFTSSYPSVMLAEKFPMSKPYLVDLRTEKFEDLLKDDDCGLIFDAKFIGLKSKFTFESYLSESKCFSQTNATINNGRIFEADEIITTITDIDYRIMLACYEWEHVEVANCKKFYMQYLPTPIIQSILELYAKKTTLKGVSGYETEYLLSKGMLNSIYGMCVTDIVRDEIEYLNDWIITKPDDEQIKTQIETYNETKSRFLYYPWGVWITAYARLNLWNGILNIGSDYVYSDTDSIKLLNYEKHQKYIQWYNEDLKQKLKRMCEFKRIEYSMMEPKTKEGIIKPIGFWDFDGYNKHFKTLGAKRYMGMGSDDSLTLTVAGLSKRNGIDYMLEACKGIPFDVFAMFNDELFIPANRTGKNTHTYIDEMMKIQSTDYQGNIVDVEIESSIHLGECEFTLSISKTYNKFLCDFRNGYLFLKRKGV